MLFGDKGVCTMDYILEGYCAASRDKGILAF